HPLVYLDNAATTQKPQNVINTITGYYERLNANIHRGVHFLSQRSTDAYETARRKLRLFINATQDEEIIFLRGATEAVNLLAQTWAKANVKPGETILISEMEHHSNIVPWQLLAQQTGILLKIIPITDDGEIDMDAYQKLLAEGVKLVSVVHMANSLGTINPVKEMTKMAHNAGALIMVDGAQAAAHIPVDVQDIDCDFYAVSGHKMFAPTGIGALYGKRDILDKMPPYHGGGDMILNVTFDKTEFNDVPMKFEAGTPNISGALGLSAAISWISQYSWDDILRHEHDLLQYGTEALSEAPGVSIIGNAKEKGAIISFSLKGIHPHDIGTILDQEGVAVRTGHHCTQPVMRRFGLPATTRASMALYNTRGEIDALVKALHKVRKVFA
ncbi:MAG TPA: cysteine desulfurase, partial [Candidatus Marinimicrobia bacterium]|nr:cysteine desulfurase [Candidatus Neomarinimicrobiota bacterium]